MDKKEFIKELLMVAAKINANETSLSTLDNPNYIDMMYFEFELVPLDKWKEVCKHLGETWRTPNFPALAVFKDAYRNLNTAQSSKWSMRHENVDRNAISDDIRLYMFFFGVQGIITEQVRQTFNKKNGLHKDCKIKGGDQTLLMREFYRMKRDKGQVFDVKRECWVEMSQSERDKHFGTLQRDYWIPEHRYSW